MQMKSSFVALSEQGEYEIGSIFPSGVPLKDPRPHRVNIQGEDESREVFLVNWRDLNHLQRDMVVDYVRQKMDSLPGRDAGIPSDIIREQFDSDGYFPIRSELVIRPYDMRFFM